MKPGGHSRASPHVSLIPKTLLDKHKGCFKDISCPQRWWERRGGHGGVGSWSTKEARPQSPIGDETSGSLEDPSSLWNHRGRPPPSLAEDERFIQGDMRVSSRDWGLEDS